MNLRQRPDHAPPRLEEPYNIIPIHSFPSDHPSLRYSEVRAAVAALREVGDPRRTPFREWRDGMDLMDWLGELFGFQKDNVRNQREHLVLHLANAQMRLSRSPPIPDKLDPGVLRRFRLKLLKNYESWCSYLRLKSQVRLSASRHNADTHRRELLYAALYLLIWGESGNLRFIPECLCYIYHHLALELNQVLAGDTDANTGRPFNPSISGENAFLNKIVTPIYLTIKSEVERSRNGTAPHSSWRNYDDVNEFFWSRKCFKKLKWPMDLSSNFFVLDNSDRSDKNRVGKTGFVEQRAFWNVFRSFDRLWVMLILFFQAAVIVAWDKDSDRPWRSLAVRDVQVELLTVFITWAGLRLLQSVLDAGTQYCLVSRESKLLLFRMVLKTAFASTWAATFAVFYVQIWAQKNSDGRWSDAANDKILVFLKAALVYSVPELLALALFILPWVRNFIEEADFVVFDMLTWWFHSRIFVGRGLHEGLISNVKYTVFWILVLLSKFSFSYFLQIRPLVAQTRALINLPPIQYNWHEFFGYTNRVAIVLYWVPVVLIYLVDLQIWYTVFSSLVGLIIGLFLHLGEIRNIGQLRLRFQFFAGALQFNLMPEDQKVTATVVQKLRDAIRRLKFRYGLYHPFKKIESSQVDTTRFALIWNEILFTMREEDLVSDGEVELMELAPNCWDVTVVRWPCFLLCNELLLAVHQAVELADAPDRWVWYRICTSEYRRCAVLEAYCSVRFLVLEVVRYGSVEHAIVTKLFMEIDRFIQIGKFTEVYKATVLPRVHERLVSLIGLVLSPEQNVNRLIDVLQALYELAVKELPRKKKPIEELRRDGLGPADAGLLFVKAVRFPDPNDAFFRRQVRRLRTILTSRDSMRNVPKNLKARRRIAFFSNSLFMNIPRAPPVEKMVAFSVLMPYYDEVLMYGKGWLRSPNEDGISRLFYLQKIYPDEWENFMERMHSGGMANDGEIFTTRSRELRAWASYRGQTLSRTVRGMMYYYRALKMLAFLDSGSEEDLRQGPGGPRALNQATSGVGGNESACVTMKLSYVIVFPNYGARKRNKDPRAEEISNLMKHNEALRVAYLDEVRGRDEVGYYSVLIKFDPRSNQEEEVYRIKLPGLMKLGEGKPENPENQNHAIIFTRGDALQKIDMNQVNSFEEALKMRNLLEEFKISHGIRKPTILRVRENIFTGSVSSVAGFMSAQEMSFVTLGQRVLADPLKVRMHYGQPDVFDRFWFLTRGGISKASGVINISEDIFAGFNCTLRGGNVTHHEYIQVGKGRDVGLNQISMFEAKVALGNGEQTLSRDVYRLGHRLDFFRMLSFFYTTVGFFYNTMVVVMMVYAFLWGRLYLAWSGVEGAAMDVGRDNKAFAAVLSQQFAIQIGVFTALPMVIENSLEHGFLSAVWDYVTMQLQLASFFFTFSMGTRAHYFGRTILHGGAKYRATGRGFEHKSFAENYRLYSRSHFVKAIELGVVLIVYDVITSMAVGTFLYVVMNVSIWFLVVSWMMAPFIFNPSGFDWLKTVHDFNDFVRWMWHSRGVFVKAEQSWETWWYEEQDHLRTTGLWGKLLEIVLDLRFFFFQYGILYHLHIADHNTSIVMYLLSWVFMIGIMVVYVVIAYAQDKYEVDDHFKYRLLQLLLVFVAVLVAVMVLTRLTVLDMFLSMLAFVPTGWGLISIAQVLRPFLQNWVVWDLVVWLARLYDMLVGMLVLAPLAFLSWMPGFESMQTRILFNEAFSRELQISRILTGKKINTGS